MATKKKFTECVWCGNPLGPGRKMTCSKECELAHAKQVKWTNHHSVFKGVHEKPVKVVVNRRIIITDEEQRKIDVAVDVKQNLKFECRTIKPGDPGFDAIAGTVTPLDKIKKSNYYTEDFLGRY